MLPIPISFTITGIDERIRAMEGLELQLGLNITVALEWFGSTATQEMITQHSFINRTGRLERSIGYHVESPRDHFYELHIYALAPYAEAVELGVPGRSRPYAFFWPAFYTYLPELYERLAEGVATAFQDATDTGRLG